MQRTFLILSALILAAPLPAAAQGLPTAARITGVDRYRASFAKFKPGAGTEARQIIYEHLIKADQAAGRNPITFDFVTGEWDHVVFFPLQDGPGDLVWSTRPIDERWWAELAKLEGGIQQARTLVARFEQLIERSTDQVVQRRR